MLSITDTSTCKSLSHLFPEAPEGGCLTGKMRERNDFKDVMRREQDDTWRSKAGAGRREKGIKERLGSTTVLKG